MSKPNIVDTWIKLRLRKHSAAFKKLLAVNPQLVEDVVIPCPVCKAPSGTPCKKTVKDKRSGFSWREGMTHFGRRVRRLLMGVREEAWEQAQRDEARGIGLRPLR